MSTVNCDAHSELAAWVAESGTPGIYVDSLLLKILHRQFFSM